MAPPPRGATGSPELVLQMIVSAMLVLETELKSTERTTNKLGYRPWPLTC